MPVPKMRPSFVVEAACDFDDLMRALHQKMEEEPGGVSGHFSRKNGILSVAAEEQHFWSPVLDLTITASSPNADAGEVTSAPVEVLGVFSPRPEIWTGLIFAIGSLTILSIISTFF